jgi:uncharacterized membrane protein (DUF485 family)
MTARKDNWKVETLPFLIVFGLFVVYTTYRMFDNQHYMLDAPGQLHLLSPFYSPLVPLKIILPQSLPLIGGKMISPAIYILIFPLSFRMTCYYYRKAYYRAVFRDPAACAVGEPMPDKRMKYTGERAFPFIVQNFHRYAFYAAAVFILLLGYDTLLAFLRITENGGKTFGMGVGTLVFLANWILLACYTFGCHSCRHLTGGGLDCYSCGPMEKTRYGLWKKITFLNERHAQFAWLSMISVGLTDVYVNIVSRGIIPDIRFF